MIKVQAQFGQLSVTLSQKKVTNKKAWVYCLEVEHPWAPVPLQENTQHTDRKPQANPSCVHTLALCSVQTIH